MIARNLVQDRPTAWHGDGARTTRSPSGRWLIGTAYVVGAIIAFVACESRVIGTSSAAEAATPASIGSVQEATSSAGTKQYSVDAHVVFIGKDCSHGLFVSDIGKEFAAHEIINHRTNLLELASIRLLVVDDRPSPMF